MSHQKKKINRIVELARTQDLSEYYDLLKVMKKDLPMFLGTKRIAAALLKEYLGDISGLDITKDLLEPALAPIPEFEEVKDGQVRLFINVGKKNRLSPGDLIREIVRLAGIDGKLIGKIDIHETYSFFEIPVESAELVMISLNGNRIRGAKVVVEPAKRKKRA